MLGFDDILIKKSLRKCEIIGEWVAHCNRVSDEAIIQSNLEVPKVLMLPDIKRLGFKLPNNSYTDSLGMYGPGMNDITRTHTHTHTHSLSLSFKGSNRKGSIFYLEGSQATGTRTGCGRRFPIAQAALS